MAAQQTHRLIEALDEPSLLLTRSGEIRHANAAAVRTLGMHLSELVGRPLSRVSAETPEKLSELLRRFFGVGTPIICSLKLPTGDGTLNRYVCRGCRVIGLGDGAEALALLRLQLVSPPQFGVLTEKIVALNVELRRNQEIRRELETALQQKQILLRELHHRVKNNLQTLLGILSLAERKTKQHEARQVIGDARSRVEALAVLQRLLYWVDDVENVDAGRFLREICSHAARAYHRDNVALEVACDALSLGVELASGIGLIANELVINAYKHAFPSVQSGVIQVQLRRGGGPDGPLVLVVEDDGNGLCGEETGGMGLVLVRGLTKQLGGICRREPAAGVRWVIQLGKCAAPALDSSLH